jgi:zinc protease
VKGERRHYVDEYPAGDLDEQLHAAAFLAHPYRWPIVGWPEDLDAMSVDDIRDYFRIHYRPGNATVAVAGAVDPQRTLDEVERVLGALEPGPPQPPVVRSEPAQRGQRRLSLRREAQLAMIGAGFHVPDSSSPDVAALEVLQAILSDGDSSRLRRALVLEGELAVDVGLGFPWALDPTLLTVELTVRHGVDPARAEATLHETLASLEARPPDERELRKAKNGLVAFHWRQLKTNEGRAEMLCRFEALRCGAEGLFHFPEEIEAVTVDDVVRVARETFRTDNRTVAVLEPLTRGPA